MSDANSLDFYHYSICRAIAEQLGETKADEVHDRAAEVGYAKLKGDSVIKTDGMKPIDVLVEIVRFFERNGYMERVGLDRVSATELIVDLHDVSIMESSKQLKKEGFTRSHFMTKLLRAALRDLGVKTGFEETFVKGDTAFVRQRWTLEEGR